MVSHFERYHLLSLIKDNARLLYGPGYTYYITTSRDSTNTAQAKLFGYNVNGIGVQVLRVGNAANRDMEQALVNLHVQLMTQVSVITGKSIKC